MMEKLRLWAWYFALIASAVLALITFYTGESFLRIVLSAIIGFTLIYGISMISIAIFEKTSLEVVSQEVGTFLDIAVGQEENIDFEGSTQGTQEPDNSNSAQITYSQKEQKPTARAGQLNQEFAEGLPSAEKQAEMVRRMGWGD